MDFQADFKRNLNGQPHPNMHPNGFIACQKPNDTSTLNLTEESSTDDVR